MIKNVIEYSQDHPYYKDVKEFYESGIDRKNANIKSIRSILASFITNKPWEVFVGQTIASLLEDEMIDDSENSLKVYLGEKVCKEIYN